MYAPVKMGQGPYSIGNKYFILCILIKFRTHLFDNTGELSGLIQFC